MTVCGGIKANFRRAESDEPLAAARDDGSCPVKDPLPVTVGGPMLAWALVFSS